MIYAVSPLAGINPEPFIANIPGSKSLTNRALIIAAQRMGVTHIRRALHCDDTDYLANCLNQFGGLSVEKTADGYRVTRSREKLLAPENEIFVGGAGTPARFLLSFATTVEGSTVITGNARLCERPMRDLLAAFDKIGVHYDCLKSPGHLPVRVQGTHIVRKRWDINGSTSSQFTSSLILLAACQDSGPITIQVDNKLVSRPYVDMTIQMLKENGITVRSGGEQKFIVEPAPPNSDTIEIEADASGMSYFLAAAALTKSRVVIPNIGRDSAQGDLGFARVLGQMGATVTFGANAIELEGGKLTGIDVDMDHMPDTVLTLAVVAPFAEGKTHVSNIANLRVKECDRIHAAAAELGRLGIRAEEGPDSITIHPGTVTPASIHTYDDHRVAMAFALIGLLHPGVEIEDPKCVAKSFPEFWTEFERFRAHHALVPALA
ncbi:MAG: 3-phosphoshikimate 1-carboxyvinyltransferase [Rhodospirillaceae bacterium]|nr:3-phosphoshikimate 1-carboxyvinyltransferase [Rhodospirillales bacterium]